MALGVSCAHQAFLQPTLSGALDEHGHSIIATETHACTQSLESLIFGDSFAAFKGASVPQSIDDCITLTQRCRKSKNSVHAYRMHLHIHRTGLECQNDLGNYLVPMFVECRNVFVAEQVFNRLVQRSEHSWTSLIQGYVECEDPNYAFTLFEKMGEDCVRPSKHTYVALLNACARLKHLEKGQERHAEIAMEGLEVLPYVGNALVDMYAKCGSLVEASDVFNTLVARDVVSWTALITGYTEQGLGAEALKCLQQMQSEGVHPNDVTYLCSLKACGGIGDIDRGREIHTRLVIEEFEKGPLIESTLVDMYAKCGLLAEAQDLFDAVPVRDTVIWNTLIAGYAEHGSGKEALRCLDQMGSEGVPPDMITHVCSLKACGCVGAIGKGQELHAEAIIGGLESDIFIGSTLVGMYAKCGAVAEARDVLEELPTRGVVTWNALISGFAEHGLAKEALCSLKQMQAEGLSSDVVAWSAVISSFAEQGENEVAFELVSQMQEQGVAPNRVTFLSILKACGNLAAIQFGRKVHAQINHVVGLEATSIVTATALIDMYGDCGYMACANKVFDTIPVKDLVIWNALIRGYLRQGKSNTVFYLTRRVRNLGMKPDGIAAVNVLMTCTLEGMLEEGEKAFETMGEEYGFFPTIQHQNCLVNLLCQTGQMDVVVAMLENTPLQLDFVSLSTLLGACQKWGNIELGSWIFERAMRMVEEDAASLVSMSNIFADVRHMYD